MSNKKMWNEVAGHYQKTVHEDNGGYPDQLIAFLKAQGMLIPGNRVADVGCGAGKYALRFAECGCDLLLLDIAENMMEYTLQNLASYTIRIDAAVCDWEEISLDEQGWRQSVDLAFAAMTPAVSTREDLEKLSAISRKGCFISKFISMDNHLLHDIEGALGYFSGQHWDQEDALNCLRWVLDAGFLPRVRFVPYGWENIYTLDEAKEYFLAGDFGKWIRENGKEEDLNALLRSAADGDGYLHETVSAQTMWLFWDVRR